MSGVSSLKLNASVLAQIFQGKITTWNNTAIAALNPGVSLPSTPITVVVRSDGSGTTQNFSEYLVKAAASAWKLGSASTIKFPSSFRAESGGSAVASTVKSTPGAIGYVDYSDRLRLQPERRVDPELGRRLRGAIDRVAPRRPRRPSPRRPT